LGEVKNRTHQKFTVEEATRFLQTVQEIKEIEGLPRVVGFIFSRNGFTPEAVAYCRTNGLAYTDSEQWLDT
jgi:hypothetical protein